MKWFKHHSGARRNLDEVMDDLGPHFGYACYFMLTEFLADLWDGHSEPVFRISRLRVANELRTKPSRVEFILNSFRTHSQLQFSSDGNILTISHPKLKEIKDEYTRKSGHAPDTVLTVEEDKETDKEEDKETDSAELENSSLRGPIHPFQNDPEIEKALRTVLADTQNRWLKLYHDAPWVRSEILKAIGWIELNPRKAPKNFARFMGNWLSRGWENYRKTIQSKTAANVINWDKVYSGEALK